MRNVGQTLGRLARLTRHVWAPSLGTRDVTVGPWRSAGAKQGIGRIGCDREEARCGCG
jgi:hypothetical protein